MILERSNPEHDRVEERMGLEIVAWLTTVNAEGQPQSSPVWFLWDGTSFLVYSRPGSHKVPNIEENPRVSVTLRGTETGEDIAIFEGTAAVSPDVPPADQIPEYLEKYRDSIRSEGWTPEVFASMYSTPIRVTPTRARIW